MNKVSDVIKNPYHTPNNQMMEQLTVLRREMGLVRSYSTTESLAGNLNSLLLNYTFIVSDRL